MQTIHSIVQNAIEEYDDIDGGTLAGAIVYALKKEAKATTKSSKVKDGEFVGTIKLTFDMLESEA